MALHRYAAKFDSFLSLDCAPTPSTLAQSKERKVSNFAIWQPWRKMELEELLHGADNARAAILGAPNVLLVDVKDLRHARVV